MNRFGTNEGDPSILLFFGVMMGGIFNLTAPGASGIVLCSRLLSIFVLGMGLRIGAPVFERELSSSDFFCFC